jgi:hypothetical protein
LPQKGRYSFIKKRREQLLTKRKTYADSLSQNGILKKAQSKSSPKKNAESNSSPKKRQMPTLCHKMAFFTKKAQSHRQKNPCRYSFTKKRREQLLTKRNTYAYSLPQNGSFYKKSREQILTKKITHVGTLCHKMALFTKKAESKSSPKKLHMSVLFHQEKQ